MNVQEFNKLGELPTQKYCEKILELFPLVTGYAYKIDKAFSECMPDDIVYVPEHGFDDLPLDITYYTKQDMIDECNGSTELAEYLFEGLEWQYLSTYIEELCHNYTDIVIDYQKDRIHDGSIHEALWNMLSEQEQQRVLQECK